MSELVFQGGGPLNGIMTVEGDVDAVPGVSAYYANSEDEYVYLREGDTNVYTLAWVLEASAEPDDSVDHGGWEDH